MHKKYGVAIIGFCVSCHGTYTLEMSGTATKHPVKFWADYIHELRDDFLAHVPSPPAQPTH